MLELLLRSTRNRVVLAGVAAAAALGLAVPASAALLTDARGGTARGLPAPVAQLCGNPDEAAAGLPAESLPTSIPLADCDLRGARIRAGSLTVPVPSQAGRGATVASVLTPTAGPDTVASLSVVNTGTEILVQAVRVDGTTVTRGVRPAGVTGTPPGAAARGEENPGTKRGNDAGSDGGNHGNSAAAPDGCSSTAHRYTGGRNDGLRWYLDADSVPGYLSEATVTQALIRGAESLTRGTNDCGLGGLRGARHSYQGTTSSGAGCHAPDGRSVVDFGPRPAGTLATTCWWYSTIDDIHRVFEADTRLRKAADLFYFFEPDNCRDRYELAGVAAHGFGHAFGLAHVSERDHPHQTMSPVAPTCSYGQTSLGQGDWTGLRELYG